MNLSWQTIGFLAMVVHVASWLAAGHALLHKKDSRSAFGWAAVCLLTPFLGPFLYALFGIARTESRAARMMEHAALLAGGSHAGLDEVFFSAMPRGAITVNKLPPAFRLFARPGFSLSHRHVVGGNTVLPCHNGEEAYPRMLDAIRNARHRIYLSTFIFGRDSTGEAFASALIEAAGKGVDVRLLVDGVGAFWMGLPHVGWLSKLKRGGVRIARFLPPGLFPPRFSINLRTHRKLLVCDGAIGFAGGMNISSHHLVNTGRSDCVQDMHFQCTGPIAAQLQTGFLMDWAFVTGEAAHSPLDPPVPVTGNTCCRLLMDGPGNVYETIHDLFCAVVSSAQHSVRIINPYFLPTHELASALSSAVLRGVRVEVILPLLNNHRMVDWAMRHQLPELVRRGIRILYQPPPFAHTKLMLVDDVYTLMGSSNLDPRSLKLNFELVVEILDSRLSATLRQEFDTLQKRSIPLSPNLPRSLVERLRNAFCWILSPYL